MEVPAAAALAPVRPRGGTDGAVGYSSVETRHARGEGEWHYVSPMPVPRADFAAGVAGGIVYAAGGIGPGGAALDAVDRYDPERDEWRPAPALPVPL
ncbi:kelch repeat-containing protein, partial [Amycolatopsis sp. SID8362]|uniref:kelch repeat-containing protein n=1 Tax=Amycolatopsis sp. SID8362 TaxID=2690346 RepID=UPI0014296DD9